MQDERDILHKFKSSLIPSPPLPLTKCLWKGWSGIFWANSYFYTLRLMHPSLYILMYAVHVWFSEDICDQAVIWLAKIIWVGRKQMMNWPKDTGPPYPFDSHLLMEVTGGLSSNKTMRKASLYQHTSTNKLGDQSLTEIIYIVMEYLQYYEFLYTCTCTWYIIIMMLMHVYHINGWEYI